MHTTSSIDRKSPYYADLLDSIRIRPAPYNVLEVSRAVDELRVDLEFKVGVLLQTSSNNCAIIVKGENSNEVQIAIDDFAASKGLEIFRVSSETFKLSDQTLEAFSNKSETIIEIVQNAAEANSEKLAVVHIALDHMNFDQLSQGSLFLQDICRAPDVGSANGLGKLLFIFFNIQQ